MRLLRNYARPAPAGSLFLGLALLTGACASDATEPTPPEVEGRGLVQGVVFSIDGLPVEGARVRVTPRYGSFSPEPATGVLTDAEGRYEIRLETANLQQADFRGDVGVATTSSTIYFRDTLVYNVRLRLAETTATTVLDVEVDGCPVACPQGS